jgi:hypothetical protein
VEDVLAASAVLALLVAPAVLVLLALLVLPVQGILPAVRHRARSLGKAKVLAMRARARMNRYLRLIK